MKKIFAVLFVSTLLVLSGKGWAQCKVTIASASASNPLLNTTQLTCRTPGIRLTANAAGSEKIRYAWSNDSTTASILITQEGFYSVTITDTNDCTTSASILITKDITPPVLEILPFPDFICLGGTANLVAIGAETYTWSPGDQSGAVIRVSPTTTTTYTVTGTGTNGCKANKTVQVAVHSGPDAVISGSTTVCQNTSSPLVTFAGSGGTRPYTFSYTVNGGAMQTITTGATSDQVTVAVPTGTLGSLTYRLVSVADRSGCPQSQNKTATVTILEGPVLTSPRTASICDNSQFNYVAKSSAANTSFTWVRRLADSVTSTGTGTGNTAVISEVLRNTTAKPVDVFYVFSLSTGSGCTTLDSVKLTINPTPTIKAIENRTYCNGTFASAGVSFSGNTPGSIFTWANSNPAIGLPSNGTGSIPAFIATNTTDSTLTAVITVRVTASADGCSGKDTSFTIRVRPGPALTSPKNLSLCDNSLFSYTATSSAQATSFNWTRLPAPGVTGSGPVTGTSAEISDILKNLTTQPVVVNYVVDLSTGGACDSRDTVKVTVNPTPVIDKIANAAFCNGASTSGISFSSVSPNASFTWTNTNPSIGLPVSGSGSIPSFTATNTTDSTITANIRVSVKASADGCSGKDTSFTITIRPGPALTSPREVSVCDNAPFSYTATSSGDGIRFSWRRDIANHVTGTGPSSGAGPAITDVLRNVTDTAQKITYRFQLLPPEGSSGCTVTQVVTVTVNPTPTINRIMDTAICNAAFVAGGIRFNSPTPNAAFSWTNNNANIGLPASGSGNIPPFNAKNTTQDSINAVITVSVDSSGNRCAGDFSRSFVIWVRPGPSLETVKVLSVCNNTPVKYKAASSAIGTTFSWQRDSINGVSTLFSTRRDLIYKGRYSDTVDTIDEILYNTTDEPIDVFYVFTLRTGGLCDTKDSVRVRLFPTPSIKSPPQNLAFCNSIVAQSISFDSRTKDANFTWSSDQKVGFGDSGTGRIPAFLTNNSSDTAITANLMVKASTGTNCPGDSARFTIKVNPTPVLSSNRDTSVCNNVAFRYTARSSAPVTSFRWRREPVTGISNLAAEGTSAGIEETLNNTTDLPVKVQYLFSLSTGGGCDSLYRYAVNVTVNPTPRINPVTNKIYCNRDFVRDGIAFTSPSPNPVFTWFNDNPRIGLPVSGTGDIPGFIATNKTTIADTALITVYVKASADSCAGTTSLSFRIVVRPSPLQPAFTSLLGTPQTQTLALCSGSENINFNINLPSPGVKYQWSSAPAIPIRNAGSQNAVMSFFQAGNYTVRVIAEADSSGCKDTVSQQVVVGPRASRIEKEKIFLSQPGDLLIYPDNTLPNYQWGVDTIIKAAPDSAFGAPKVNPGQVYQFYVPDTRLDTTKYLYWVLLQDAQGCQTRVYYNGPYANRRIQTGPPVSPTVQIQVSPNPGDGEFDVSLSGTIYGKMEAKVLNSLGHTVYQKQFVKTVPVVKERFLIRHLPAGLYFLELQSSNLKRIVTRFVIQH